MQDFASDNAKYILKIKMKFVAETNHEFYLLHLKSFSTLNSVSILVFVL